MVRCLGFTVLGGLGLRDSVTIGLTLGLGLGIQGLWIGWAYPFIHIPYRTNICGPFYLFRLPDFFCLCFS